ncbi:MAG: hypothetical protein K8R59_00540 [Thermoanaerobaculales bacterium]|nr:hypothetical protein [Thermoanaerobaculales bacterium]
MVFVMFLGGLLLGCGMVDPIAQKYSTDNTNGFGIVALAVFGLLSVALAGHFFCLIDPEAPWAFVGMALGICTGALAMVAFSTKNTTKHTNGIGKALNQEYRPEKENK